MLLSTGSMYRNLTVPFTPIDPATLSPTGWYDPSDLSTLWQDTAATSPVTTDGQSVARINDKSGNGRNLTQASAGGRPIYHTSGGLHWLEFDGSDDALNAAVAVSNFIANSAHEVCVGFRADTIAQNNATNVFSNMATWGDNGGFVSSYLRNNGNGGTAGTAALAGAYNWDGNADKAENAYTVAADAIFSQRHDSGNILGRLNSLTETSAASGNTSNIAGILRLGVQGGSSGITNLDGRIYGFFIKNAVLSTQERLDLREYMAYKSGVTL